MKKRTTEKLLNMNEEAQNELICQTTVEGIEITPKELLSKFSMRLNKEILASEYSKTSLAKLVGVKKACLSDYCCGRIFPSMPVFFKICKYLDVSADYLLGLSDY